MSLLLASVRKELILLSRDLHGLAVLFVMPIVFMLIMSVALSREDQPHQGTTLLLVGHADNPLNAAWATQMQQQGLRPQLQLHDAGGLPAAREAALQTLRQGTVKGVIVNPNTQAAALADDQPLELLVAAGTDRAWTQGLRALLQPEYTRLRLQRLQHHAGDAPATDDPRLPGAMGEAIATQVRTQMAVQIDRIADYLDRPLLDVVHVGQHGTVRRPGAVQHSVPAWLIFGMFFIMIPLSNVMAMERQTNTLTRLRMAQAPAGLLIVAKLLPYFLINLLQFGGMLLLGRWVLPLLDIGPFSMGSALSAGFVLAAATSLAALGYGLLISVSARSTEHAVVLGGGGIIIMAALGGVMVPAWVMPETMQTISRFSPMAWALQGFHELVLDGKPLAALWQPLALLGGFGLFCLTLASLIYHHQLKTQARF